MILNSVKTTCTIKVSLSRLWVVSRSPPYPYGLKKGIQGITHTREVGPSEDEVVRALEV